MAVTRKDLWRMWSNTDSVLMADVIEDVFDKCDTDEDVQNYLMNVYKHGGINSAIPSLIYYDECEEFVKEHLTEILDIYNEAKVYLDPKEEVHVDTLAWLGYETMVNIILSEQPINDYHM